MEVLILVAYLFAIYVGLAALLGTLAGMVFGTIPVPRRKRRPRNRKLTRREIANARRLPFRIAVNYGHHILM